MRAPTWSAEPLDALDPARIVVGETSGLVSLWDSAALDTAGRVYLPRARDAVPGRNRPVAIAADENERPVLAVGMPEKPGETRGTLILAEEDRDTTDAWKTQAHDAPASLLDLRFAGAANRYVIASTGLPPFLSVFDRREERWIEPPEKAFAADTGYLRAFDVRSLDEDSDPVVVAGGQNGDLVAFRLAGSDGNAPRLTPLGTRRNLGCGVFDVALHPDLDRLAVAYDRSVLPSTDAEAPYVHLFGFDRKEKGAQGTPRTVHWQNFERIRGYTFLSEQDISSVAWNDEGTRLFAGGHLSYSSPTEVGAPMLGYDGDEQSKIRQGIVAWDLRETAPEDPQAVRTPDEQFLPTGIDRIMRLAPFGTGGVFFAAQDPAFGAYTFTRDGTPKLAEPVPDEPLFRGASSFDMRYNRTSTNPNAFAVTPDLRKLWIRIAPHPFNRIATFDFDTRSLRFEPSRNGDGENRAVPPGYLTGLHTEQDGAAGWSFGEDGLGHMRTVRESTVPACDTDREWFPRVVAPGAEPVPVNLDRSHPRVRTDGFRSADVLVPDADGNGIAEVMLVGSDNFLRAIDVKGTVIAERELTHSAYRALAVTRPDGARVAVIAHSDGVVRYYRYVPPPSPTEQGRFVPFLNLLISRDPRTGEAGANDWTLWTENGFFDIGGGDNALDHIGRAEDDGGFRTLDEDRRRFQCGAVIDGLLDTLDEASALRDLLRTEAAGRCASLVEMKAGSGDPAALGDADLLKRASRTVRRPRLDLLAPQRNDVVLEESDLLVRFSAEVPRGLDAILEIRFDGVTVRYDDFTDAGTISDRFAIFAIPPEKRCPGKRFALDLVAIDPQTGRAYKGSRIDRTIIYDGPRHTACRAGHKGNLWIVLIAETYEERDDLRLFAPPNDAAALARTFCARDQREDWLSVNILPLGAFGFDDCTPATSLFRTRKYADLVKRYPTSSVRDRRYRLNGMLDDMADDFRDDLTREAPEADMRTGRYRKGDTLIVHFAGHGHRSKAKGYEFLLGIDDDGNGDLEDGQISLDRLFERLLADDTVSALDLHPYIFIDACGKAPETVAALREESVSVSDSVKKIEATLARSGGICYATAPTQRALEAPVGTASGRTRHGAFSLATVEGLTHGKAQTVLERLLPPSREEDRNDDLLHFTELSEYYRYAMDGVFGRMLDRAEKRRAEMVAQGAPPDDIGDWDDRIAMMERIRDTNQVQCIGLPYFKYEEVGLARVRR